MIARELLLLALVLAGSALAVAAYLYLFHQSLSTKEIGSSAAAMTLGVMIGRAWGLRTARG